MYAGVPTIASAPTMLNAIVAASSADVAATAAAFARPKSSSLTTPSGVILMFAGFRVAMHDPVVVRGREPVGDLSRDAERLVERNRPLLDALGQRRPLDELHDERLVLDAVDRRDVRMIERGEHLRFAREARQAQRILGQGRRKSA